VRAQRPVVPIGVDACPPRDCIGFDDVSLPAEPLGPEPVFEVNGPGVSITVVVTVGCGAVLAACLPPRKAPPIAVMRAAMAVMMPGTVVRKAIICDVRSPDALLR